MKNFDLEAYGVSEMTQSEMMDVDGGNIFDDIWNGIKAAANWVAQIFTDAIASLEQKVINAMWDEYYRSGGGCPFNGGMGL
jgi:hypothetical protein